MTLHPSRH